MSRAGVHAERGEIIAKLKLAACARRKQPFLDSTGTALQDVAAAIVVYQRALESGGFARFFFGA